MHIYYNQQPFDTIMIELVSQTVTDQVIYDDVVVLYHDQTIVGYNILNASMHISNLPIGLIHPSKTIQTALNKLLGVHGLSLDFSQAFHFVIGQVLDKQPVAGSDKLNVCLVDIKDETLQIVCGAKNVAVGQKVVVAKVGARMPSGLVIEASSLKGVASNGMICSKKELAVVNDLNDEGIMVLPEDAVVGQLFER